MQRKKEKEPLRIVQITDLHLKAQSGGGLGWCRDCEGLDTSETLANVLDDIQINEPCFNALVVTGDIAQDGDPDAYRMFSRLLANEGAPVYCLPGNHDNKVHLREALDGKVISMPRYIVEKEWLLLFLDTSKSGEVHGEITAMQIEWTKAIITHYPNHHVALFIHHHPVPVGSPWLDKDGLMNGEEVLDQLRQLPQIKTIVCGHIHQNLDQQVHGIRILGTPSTCLQFTPYSAQISFSPLPPAYRRLAFHADGRVETEVVYSHQPLLMSA